MTESKTVPIKETEEGYEPDFSGDRFENAEYDFGAGEVTIDVPS